MRKILAVVVMLCASAALADGRGEGGIVVTEGAEVYKKSDSDKVVDTLPAGVAVAGVIYSTANAWFGGGDAVTYQFHEKNGRLRVTYYRKTPGMIRSGWMAPGDLDRFVYDACSDGDARPQTNSVKSVWNVCFKEARDAKLEEMADHETDPGE